jgi:hypothetical protein
MGSGENINSKSEAGINFQLKDAVSLIIMLKFWREKIITAIIEIIATMKIVGKLTLLIILIFSLN